MKLLYITNGVNVSGGLERVLSIKTSYFSDVLNYDVNILTLNNGDKNMFYNFSEKIKFHDIIVNGTFFNYLLSYRKGIGEIIKNVKPDIILVCDDGLKGTLFKVIFNVNIPVIYERHVSKKIEQREDRPSIHKYFLTLIKYKLMNFGARRFDKFVVLTEGNVNEWKTLNNLEVIPNPVSFIPETTSNLDNKQILVVGKQSFQKGYDRLLPIWKLVTQKRQGWNLDIYGTFKSELQLDYIAKELGISDSVHFYQPIKNIQDKYAEASIYLMTSRFEGFGMVLVEAMSYGIPCISFDCPYGPGDIIVNNFNGFLIQEGEYDEFSDRIIELMDDFDKRKKIGQNAKEYVDRYNIEKIAKMWEKLFSSIKKIN